jgi:hypothetical protein
MEYLIVSKSRIGLEFKILIINYGAKSTTIVSGGDSNCCTGGSSRGNGGSAALQERGETEA